VIYQKKNYNLLYKCEVAKLETAASGNFLSGKRERKRERKREKKRERERERNRARKKNRQ
jgi:hypothetical protein